MWFKFEQIIELIDSVFEAKATNCSQTNPF